ncbi:uncharacterized protein B0I36DRAFT_249736 [Microdochium trichocladiopsis]|uniref:Uncharacterized protein n=1 Tax=Microdochium trichocladiopsis TaxID=1682393 RepID=A0A9P8Y0B2_9PEZI|nr:uncharacterized protein B0I36DRAFT_249736 [Microdochium trichocladiopsis]KAH7024501.1 hypothetical protein B0I36DRAFT_249736 [Microdochium trichocladiopsis]
MPLPSALADHIDRYVDSLYPDIHPRIVSELDAFQQKTIDSLEDQVVDAFRSLFNRDSNSNARQLDPNPPDAYGGQSLPFADEIAALTRGFSQVAAEAGDDLGDIFNLTEGGGGGNNNNNSNSRARGFGDFTSGGGAGGFLSAAVNAVQDHLDNRSGGGGGGGLQLDGLLGVLSDTVKDTARHPEEKARLISPEIKEHVGNKLREQHAPIAEQFTRLALEHIKRWLRGNTSAGDVGDGVRGEIHEQVQDLVKGLGGLFKGGRDRGGDGERSRGFNEGDGGDSGSGGGGGGFSAVISDKLSTGLARVHREVRLEFRTILGAIEKQLFELLPDQIQGPLERILGGNPFDSELDRNAGRAGGGGDRERGGGDFVDDVKAKLVDRIRGFVRKVQELLRENILGVVNGGHRRFERESWLFVQNMVEMKVQKYLPEVRINVPDDIGNEGVRVDPPSERSQRPGGY